jgi:hypothetical protein
MKKYFEFSNTVSGTNYFLRNLLSTFGAFGGGFLIGWGIGMEQTFFTVLGMILLVPALWLNLCTIYKRSNALFPEYATVITVGMILLQVLGEVNQLFTLPTIIMGLILLFKNSNIEEHKG